MGFGNEFSQFVDGLRRHRTPHTAALDARAAELSIDRVFEGAQIHHANPRSLLSIQIFDKQLYEMIHEAYTRKHFFAWPLADKLARNMGTASVDYRFLFSNQSLYEVEILPSGLSVASPALAVLDTCVDATHTRRPSPSESSARSF